MIHTVTHLFLKNMFIPVPSCLVWTVGPVYEKGAKILDARRQQHFESIFFGN